MGLHIPSGRVIGAISTLCLSACGGGSDGVRSDSGPPTSNSPSTYFIAGTVSGLAAGAQLELKDNGGDALSIGNNGRFVFVEPVLLNGSYAVTIGSQPAGQTCTVSNGSGAGVVADIANVRVDCSTTAFTVSGAVVGLAAGNQVTLMNNGADALTRGSDGNFTFSAPVALNGSYAVTVQSQPPGQTCTVTKGSAAGVVANASNVAVVCSAASFVVSGNVSGLNAGKQVTLNNNNADALIIGADGSFRFETPVAYQAGFAVTVGTQPVGQTCTVSDASGSDVVADVSTVAVVCSSNTYVVAGTLSGLAAGKQVTLVNNGADPITVTVDGSFSFNVPVAYNGSYAVTVGTQPVGMRCSVSNGSDVKVTADYSGVGIVCERLQYAYVVNSYGDSVSQYSIGATGELTPLTPASVSTAASPVSIAVDPTGHYAYVPCSGDGVISQFTIGADGTLAPIPNPPSASHAPMSVVADSSGRWVYVTIGDESGVYRYDIGANGALTGPSGIYAVGHQPFALALDPTASHAYVVNMGDNTLLSFSLGADGSLTPVGGLVATGSGPLAVTVDRTDHFAYVVNNVDSSVSQFSIGSNGALTPVSTIAVGDEPTSIVIDPSNRYAYMGNADDDVVTQFNIGADGSLTPMSIGSVASGGTPVSLAIDRTGRYLYAVSQGPDLISEYFIGADGALTPMTKETVRAGYYPAAIALSTAY